MPGLKSNQSSRLSHNMDLNCLPQDTVKAERMHGVKGNSHMIVKSTDTHVKHHLPSYSKLPETEGMFLETSPNSSLNLCYNNCQKQNIWPLVQQHGHSCLLSPSLLCCPAHYDHYIPSEKKMPVSFPGKEKLVFRSGSQQPMALYTPQTTSVSETSVLPTKTENPPLQVQNHREIYGFLDKLKTHYVLKACVYLLRKKRENPWKIRQNTNI